MMAAAVAGGAIYVELEPDFIRSGFLCFGRLPNGKPVPELEMDAAYVLERLDAQAARMQKLGDHLREDWAHDAARHLREARAAIAAACA